MAQYICPSCGQRFNGRKCRSCYYETYDDEISRNLHAHQEVNVPDVPLGRPATVQKEWEQQKREFRRKQQKRRSRKAPKGIVWLLVILLLNPILSLAGLVAEEVVDTVSNISVSTREPDVPDAALPEDAEVLFSSEGFTLYYAESEDPLCYPLFLENTTSQDVRLSANAVAVDGFLSEQSRAWCEAPANTLREGELWLDEEDMALAGIEAPGQVQLGLVLYELEEYEDILEKDAAIDLGPPSDIKAPEYQVLLDTDQIQVGYVGYQAGEYEPEAFHEGTMVFFLENKTGEPVSIYSEEARLAGQEVFLSLWSELPGQTWTVSRMWMYLAEEVGVETIEQAGELELHMKAYIPSGSVDLGWIRVKP